MHTASKQHRHRDHQPKHATDHPASKLNGATLHKPSPAAKHCRHNDRSSQRNLWRWVKPRSDERESARYHSQKAKNRQEKDRNPLSFIGKELIELLASRPES